MTLSTLGLYVGLPLLVFGLIAGAVLVSTRGQHASAPATAQEPTAER